nr:J protein JJJ2-like [Coffea arabica]
MEHHTTTTRAEAERLLGIAEKLLRNRDFAGCKEFAVLAQETEPLVDGSEQILAVAQVLLASEKRIGQHNDWYSILQLPNRTDDSDLVRKQYRRFALLLHPDKNKFEFAESAFRLVADAWNVLSDPVQKSAYDKELSFFTKIDLAAMKRQKDLQQRQQQRQHKDDVSNQKLPVRRSSRGNNTANNASGAGNNASNVNSSTPNTARASAGGVI